ncbi:MAG: hypothetical protein JXM68_01900 [Sedimentisphaerales bacterium]|nr:hypothetical protein [Sedimentisphaerales bacterium]
MRTIVLLLTMLVLVCGISPVGAVVILEETPYIEIDTYSPPRSTNMPCGYHRFMVSITNRHKDPAIIELKWPGRYNVANLSRTVTVPGSGSVTVPIYTPLAIMDFSMINVYVDGSFAGRVPMAFENTGYEERLPVLVSQSVQQFEAAWRDVSDHGSAGSGNMHGKKISLDGKELLNIEPLVENINTWSNDWLAYTAYAVVVVSAEDLKTMAEPVRMALDNYIETGGIVIVMGSYSPAAHWSDSNSNTDYGQKHGKGFGALLVADQADLGQWSTDLWSALLDECYISEYFDRNKPENIFSQLKNTVVEGGRIPVGLLFTVLLVFVLVAGPLNTFVFARGVKRMRIYWIMPVCSLAATLLIVITALTAEGITPSIKTSSIVYLNENTDRSVILSLAGYYCPVPPRELLFDNDIMVSCQALGNRYDQGSRSVDYTKGQSYVGWVNARVETYFAARSTKECRDHLVVRAEADGGTSIVNNLPGEIKSLMICREDGKFYSGKNIVTGSSHVLQPEPDTMGTSDQKYLRKVYMNNSWQSVNPDVPACGTYIAVMASDPYTQTGLGQASVKVTGQNCVVFGIMEN